MVHEGEDALDAPVVRVGERLLTDAAARPWARFNTVPKTVLKIVLKTVPKTLQKVQLKISKNRNLKE